MSEKATYHHESHVSHVPEKRQKGGFRRHCARFWWIYLIVTILIILIVVLLILFVAIPRIAQQKVDAAVASIEGFSALNTQTDNYTLSLNTTTRTDGSIHATFDPFTAVMYLEDLQPHTSFADLYLPTTSSDAEQVNNITQFTPITNMAAFTAYTTWLQMNDSIRVTVEGDTNVHVSGLSKSYGVHYKKTVTMPGLRNFVGTKVTNPSVDVLSDPNADNFHATVIIPNYSIVTFEIGNVSFHNYFNSSEIGTAYIDNMILRPGNNTFAMRANIQQTPILAALSQKPYCEGASLPFQLSGKSVVNHGQPLPYFLGALAAGNQTVLIDVAGALKTGHNLTIACAT